MCRPCDILDNYCPAFPGDEPVILRKHTCETFDDTDKGHDMSIGHAWETDMFEGEHAWNLGTDPYPSAIRRPRRPMFHHAYPGTAETTGVDFYAVTGYRSEPSPFVTDFRGTATDVILQYQHDITVTRFAPGATLPAPTTDPAWADTWEILLRFAGDPCTYVVYRSHIFTLYAVQTYAFEVLEAMDLDAESELTSVTYNRV